MLGFDLTVRHRTHQQVYLSTSFPVRTVARLNVHPELCLSSRVHNVLVQLQLSVYPMFLLVSDPVLMFHCHIQGNLSCIFPVIEVSSF
jgi:hypothetical protein